MRERFPGRGGPEDDGALAGELAVALRLALPHVGVVAERAKCAFTWRTIDEELLHAQLLFDSTRTGEPVLTRDDTGTAGRVLVFTAELSKVEIEVLSDRVVGQFLPPCTGRVEIEDGAGVVTTVPVDDLGFFVIEPVPAQAVRLRCVSGTTRLVTDWIHL